MFRFLGAFYLGNIITNMKVKAGGIALTIDELFEYSLEANNDNIAKKAEYRLQEMGAEIIPDIFQVCKDREIKEDFFKMSKVLFNFGLKSIPYLIQGLKDKSSIIRTISAETLKELRSSDKDNISQIENKFIPLIIELLEDPYWKIREIAVETLSLFPRDNKFVINLIPVLSDKNKNVKYAAVEALKAIGLTPTSNIKNLLLISEQNTCEDIIESLGKIGSQEAISILIEVLEDKRIYNQKYAIKALGKIGTNAKSSVPILINFLKNGSQKIQEEVIVALGKIELDSEAKHTVAPILTNFLKNNNKKITKHAIKTLGNIGIEAKCAIPELVNILKYTPKGELKVKDDGSDELFTDTIAGKYDCNNNFSDNFAVNHFFEHMSDAGKVSDYYLDQDDIFGLNTIEPDIIALGN